MPAKKPAAKPAPKKPAPAKKPAAKPAPKKAEPAKKPAPKKPEPKKAAPSANASYHLSKREDGKWQLFITGSDKVIKTFATKAEGEAYAKERAENTGRAILKHNSKGANKGKIAKK
jgi:outer membrane biosynthesis protein TonB